MFPTPSPPGLLSPLTHFFQDIGIHLRPAAQHLAIEIDRIPVMPNPIGDIWQAEEADIAFQKGELRSWSLEDYAREGGGGGEEKDDDHDHGDIDDNNNDGSESSESDESFKDMAVIFRNESPSTLLLCWVSESGQPFHFYRLKPSKSKPTDPQKAFQRLDTDHLENTSPGHAFCLGYVHGGDDEIARVQKSKSLDRRTVVGGYRPFLKPSVSTTSSSSSSSAPTLSRRVQLVTITHVPPERQFRPTRKRTRCSLPWCFGGRKRDKDSDKDSDSDEHDCEMPLDPKGWRVSARWVRFESKPHDTTKKIYEEGTLGGWSCKLEPNWSNGDEISAQKLERDIRAASKLLPPHARAYLERHCKIWVNRSLSWGPSDCPVRGRGCCYHPGKAWLIQNGLSGEKHMCVEVNDAPSYRKDCDLWGIGGVMLHELSHAYHHGMLPDGYDNKEIQKCYELAMKEGLYDCVEYHSGFSSDGQTMKRSTAKAYACSNAMEYWAELSAAFLGGLDESKEYNKWYPFNRKQIQEHDPRAYSLLSRLWKVDANLRGTTTKT